MPQSPPDKTSASLSLSSALLAFGEPFLLSVSKALATGTRDAKSALAMVPNGRPVRLLLAEDDVEMRRMLASALSEDGFEVVEAATGAELLDHLAVMYFSGSAAERFSVIISDVRMPGFTGLEVLSGFKGLVKAPPIIIITAFGDERTHRAAEDLGAALVLDKPFDVDELLRAAADLAAVK